MAAETEFCLLGPLLVRQAGMVLWVAPGKQRALLAALLLSAGRPVPVDELAEVLWGSDPPPSARASLQTYMMRLRKSLAEIGHSRISTEPDGYLIRVGAGELDVDRFESSLLAAREAARAGSWADAAALLRAALSLWRGQPLSGVRSDALVRREMPRLMEMRLQALEARIDADLHLGRHADVIVELRQLAAAHPLRERLHGLLMIALYRDGQQAGALAAYQAARCLLVDELGAEPGHDLRQLQQQILAADADLAAPDLVRVTSGSPGPTDSVAEPGQRPDPVMPQQLPATAPHFAGRAAELQALTGLLDRAAPEMPGAVVISAIGGTAGVGKTTLAVRWAHQVAKRFPDGQLYVNLRGFDPSGLPVPPAEAVRGFLDALGVTSGQIPPTTQGQAGLYRSLLACRKMLILLDNARDAGQVRPLLPGNPACLVVVTSRNQLTGLVASDGAHPLVLDVLTHADACELMTRRLGEKRLAGAPEAAAEVIGLCARLPLALAIVAARAAARPAMTMHELADDMRVTTRRLDAIDTGDPGTSMRAVFSWSYQNLSDPAARLFRLLGVHPGPDITAAAAASLAGVPLRPAARLLAELARCHLLTEYPSGRFAFHDLLRAYAAEQASAIDSEAGRRDATQRALDHYLHTASHAAILLNPSRDRPTLQPAQPGTEPEVLLSHGQAMSWLRAEHQVLLAVIRWAVANGHDNSAWQISWALTDFFDHQGQWHDLSTTQRVALGAAERLGDIKAQAHSHRMLGRVGARLRSFEHARDHYAAAAGRYRQLGDHIGQAHGELDLAWICGLQGQHNMALAHSETALAIYRHAGYGAGQACALNSVGWHHIHMGNAQQALNSCRQALNLYREIGDERGAAATLDSLGVAYYHLAQYVQALESYRRSLQLFEELGDRYHQGYVMARIGDACNASGNPDAARDAWQQALAILDELHHPDAEPVRLSLGELDIAAGSHPSTGL